MVLGLIGLQSNMRKFLFILLIFICSSAYAADQYKINPYTSKLDNAGPVGLSGLNGNIGIGSTSPACKLDLGSGNVCVTGTPVGGAGGSPGGSNQQIQYNNSGSFGGATSFIFDGSNVGVGSATPGTKLDVTGAIRASSTITGSNLSGTNTGDQTSVTGNAGTATALAANGANCSGNNFALGVDASGVGECAQPAFSNLSGSATDSQIPNTITIDLADTVTTNANLTGNDVTSSGNAATLDSQWKGWKDGGTNVYTTTTTDNVGIGTTTPNAATLEIVKNADQPALKVSSTATANGDYLVINSTGKVGIGTSTPDGGLVVLNGNVGFGTVSPQSILQVAGDLITTKINSVTITKPAISATLTVADGKTLTVTNTANINTLTDGQYCRYTSAGTLIDCNRTCADITGSADLCDGVDSSGTGTSQWQTTSVGIGTTGLVGIGTYDPSGMLEIVQQGSNNPLMVSSTPTNDGNRLIVTSGGNVGIGTTLPVSVLDVKGSTGLTVGGQQNFSLAGKCSAFIISDAPTSLDVSGCSYYTFTSNNATSTSRTFCLNAGTEGQILILAVDVSGTNEIELGDGAAGACSGSTGAATFLNGVWPAASNQNNDMALIIYRTTASGAQANGWYEIGRSAN